MLNSLKNVALEINFSSGLVFDSNASKISQSLLSDNLTRMISSANNVNNNLMSLKDARIATQKARWDALTELNSKYVDLNQKTNQKTTSSVMEIPIIPVTSNEKEEKEKPSEKDNNEKKRR